MMYIYNHKKSQKITKDYEITSRQLQKLADDGKIRFNEPKNGSNRKTYNIGDIEKYLELNVSQPESSDKKPSARTLRRKDNEDSNEFVIKCGLDNSIKIDSNFKGDLLKELRNRMIETSRASHRVGLLVNIFIREYFFQLMSKHLVLLSLIDCLPHCILSH